MCMHRPMVIAYILITCHGEDSLDALPSTSQAKLFTGLKITQSPLLSIQSIQKIWTRLDGITTWRDTRSTSCQCMHWLICQIYLIQDHASRS